MIMRNIARFLILFLILVMSLASVSPQETKKDEENKKKSEKKNKERFSAIAQGVKGAVGGSSVFLNFQIERLTTDEEIIEYANILKESGTKGLRKKLEKVKVGRISPAGRVGNNIAIARSRKVEGGYVVTFVTARKIRFLELLRSYRSTDYPFGFFQIQFDEKGKGKGSVIVATKFFFNKNNALVIESLGDPPFRLVNAKHHRKKS